MENIRKNSILIVDDEKMNLEVLCDILSPEYAIYTANSGVSALELTNKYMPDLILLDILMPDISGFEVLETLKKSKKTRHIPVIIITGLNSVEEEERGLALDAADFIYKPFSNNVVKSRIRHQIQIVNQIRSIEEYAHNMYITLNKMEAIVNNYNGVIWSIDNKGVITSFNGQYLKKIGITPSFLIGKNVETAWMENRYLDIIDNVGKTFREGSQDWQSEINGLVFQSHTTLIHDGEGNITGIVGSSDDVTELMKLHRDLEAAVKAAENANRSKSSFLARMSHEIRTPLNAVLGIAEVELQNKTLQPDVREAFARIFNSGDLLLGIINDILDMSKIEAGKLELIPAKYDVASLINDTVYLNMIKHENKPIDFILNVDENVPSELFGDELRIKQILNNLLSNAFKYTKEGEVELSLNAEYVSSDSVTLVFRVRDTGQGMSDDQISRLFDEYSRFNMEANRTTEGTGLGMSIARNLAHMMNGELLVESEHGKGSLFTVRLPQGNIGTTSLGKEMVERLKQFRLTYKAKIGKIHVMREPIPFGKVLVVDDMEMNLYVTKGMLSPYGLQIDTAISGEEAIKKLKNSAYDLVFMDHMMPIMDGVEAARKIRKLGSEYEKLPIIALTANAVSGMKEMFLANGFNGFLSKPILMQELDKILKEWMSPEKITLYKRPETADTDETYDSFIQDVEKIGEIDTEIGLNQVMGNKGIYRNTLAIFYKKLISICDNMTASLDAKDIKNFTISVHAMKSMLAIIGAAELSETALKLEIASKNDDIDFCTRLFGEFKKKLLSLHKQLSVIFPDAAELSEKERALDNTDLASAAENSSTGKVLIVDDADMILYVIREKLSRYGLQVVTATSGPEAIDKIKNSAINGDAYDLVFMDHLMPEMDGIEAAREIRKIGPEYEKLPIIALTANADPGIEEMFLTNGFNGFLSKPVANEKLEEILKKWLPAAARL
jgi:PAS domain S-box-containing protein